MAKRHQASYDFLFMKPSGEQLAPIASMIEHGQIRPLIDREFSLEQVQDAIAYSESGPAKGKIIVQI